MRRFSFLGALLLSAACDGSFLAQLRADKGDDTSKASLNINYLIFTEDSNGVTFHDESAFGGLQLRFLLGNDPDLNGVLDDQDVVVSVIGTGEYPQLDAEDDGAFTFDYGLIDDDGDGIIEPDFATDSVGILTDSAYNINPPGLEDWALAGGSIPLGEYDLWAIEVLDAQGAPLLWKDAPNANAATRFSYDSCKSYGGVEAAACPGAEVFVIDAVTTFGFGVARNYTNLDGTETTTAQVAIYLPAGAVK